MFSFLLIENPSLASDLTSNLISSEDFSDCTESNPCYYNDGQFHHINIDSENPWNSYTIAVFTVNTCLTIATPFIIPIVHNALNRFLDYGAYKWHAWRGLRDSGGVAQTDQLRAIARSAAGIAISAGRITNVLETCRNPFLQSLLTVDEQKGDLKLISEVIEKANTESSQTNLLLNQMIGEIKENTTALVDFTRFLAHQQQEKDEKFNHLLLAIQRSQEEAIKNLASEMQKHQEKTNENFVASLTEALNELKSKDS